MDKLIADYNREVHNNTLTCRQLKVLKTGDKTKSRTEIVSDVYALFKRIEAWVMRWVHKQNRIAIMAAIAEYILSFQNYTFHNIDDVHEFKEEMLKHINKVRDELYRIDNSDDYKFKLLHQLAAVANRVKAYEWAWR